MPISTNRSGRKPPRQASRAITAKVASPAATATTMSTGRPPGRPEVTTAAAPGAGGDAEGARFGGRVADGAPRGPRRGAAAPGGRGGAGATGRRRDRSPCTVPAGIQSPCPSETVKIRSATREVSVPPRTQTSSWRGWACGDHSVGRGGPGTRRGSRRAPAPGGPRPGAPRCPPRAATSRGSPLRGTDRPCGRSLSAPVPGAGPWPARALGEGRAEGVRPRRRRR